MTNTAAATRTPRTPCRRPHRPAAGSALRPLVASWVYRMARTIPHGDHDNSPEEES